MGEEFTPNTLADNLRCKIIYYSCINPHTISDLNKAWGYSSPTYLYQNNTLEDLKDANLISLDKKGSKNLIHSNYDILFTDQNLTNSQNHINREILREYLIHSKGFQPRPETHAEMDSLMELGRRNLEPELEQELQNLEFSQKEYTKLAELWKTPAFKQIFLSLNITSRLIGKKKSLLSDQPLNHLFRLTSGLIYSMNRARGGNDQLEIPPDLKYRAEQIIVPAYRQMKKEETAIQNSAFQDRMKDVYSMFRTKFKHDRFNHDFIEDFRDLAIKDKSEKKIGKLFEKYRDSSGIF